MNLNKIIDTSEDEKDLALTKIIFIEALYLFVFTIV
jgi:hypothetical protein